MFDGARHPAAASPLWPVEARSARIEIGAAAPVAGLDLTLRPGGVAALLGPNGAGKSLALRLLAGLISPASGTVRWGGSAAPPERGVALVFQRPVLLRRSVVANIDHALRLAGVARTGRRARAEALLARCGLDAMAGRPARALSGGEQQRLAFARAMAFAPQLLLLDEPTASLDPRSAAAMESLIRDAEREGATVLLVTHDVAQARRLADRVVFMSEGRAVEEGPAARMLASPASPEARAYLDGRLPG